MNTQDPDAPPGIGDNFPPPDHPAAAPETVPEAIARVAGEAVAIMAEISVMTTKQKGLDRRLKEIQVKGLPELLAQLGTATWENDEAKVAVGTKVQGSINRAPDVEAALALLKEHGFPGPILTTMTVEFGAGEESLAEQIGALLGETFHREVALERKVHAATLAAFGREKLAGGSPIDLEALGLSSWREASVKGK